MALVQEALEGLGELGDVTAFGAHRAAAQERRRRDPQGGGAGAGLGGFADHPETLRQALQHADPQVKYHAALGLAYAGDPLVASLVFSEQAAQVLTADQRLTAAFALGPAGEDQLVVFLDAVEEPLRTRALLLLMLLEMKANEGSPARCLACLSSRTPRVRLTAARALECFSNRAVFLEFVVQLFNDRGDEPAWKVRAGHCGNHGGIARLRIAKRARRELLVFCRRWTRRSSRHGTRPGRYTPSGSRRRLQTRVGRTGSAGRRPCSTRKASCGNWPSARMWVW